MSKYYQLDMDKSAEESGGKKVYVNFLTIAAVIITAILLVRFLVIAPLQIDTYGGIPGETKECYTKSFSQSVGGYGAKSLAGHCVLTLRDKANVTTYSSIKYVGYLRSIEDPKGVWSEGYGLHEFKVTNYDGVRGDTRNVVIGLRGGFDRPGLKYFSTILYSVSSSPSQGSSPQGLPSSSLPWYSGGSSFPW